MGDPGGDTLLLRHIHFFEPNRGPSEPSLVLLSSKSFNLKIRWSLKHFYAFVLEVARDSVG